MKIFNPHFTSICLLIVVVFHAIPLFAQNQIFLHYSNRDGLPSGYIRQIMQDQRGFIWVCTNAGLSKFDGYNFTNYLVKPDDSLSISGQFVRVIKEFDAHTFLVGTNNGFDIFNPNTEIFKKVDLKESIPEINFVADIEVLESGDIWVAGEKGLYYFPSQDINAKNLDVHYYPIEIDSAQYQTFNFTSIEYDGDHSLWLGSDIYIHKFDLKDRTFKDLGPYSKEVESVLQGNLWALKMVSNGDLFITSINGLAVWRKGKSDPDVINKLGPYSGSELKTAAFQSVTEDDQGRIWLGTGTLGAIRWDRINDEVNTFRYDNEDENSINSDDVHFAFADDQYNIWFGYHRKGISLMYNNAWEYTYKIPIVNLPSDDPANTIEGLAEDAEGNLWFISQAGIIYQPADGSQAVLYPIESKEKFDEAYFTDPIFQDEHLIILGERERNAIIYEFNLNSKKFSKISEYEGFGMTTFNNIEAGSHLYFSTTNKNIIRFDKNTNEMLPIEVPQNKSISSLFSPVLISKYDENDFFVQQFYFVNQNVEWESFLFNPDSLTFSKLDSKPPANISIQAPPIVSDLLDGVIWAILSNGILRHDFLTSTNEILFRNEAALLNESNSTIIEDKEGNLWMNNQTGIMRLNPSAESITHFEMKQNQKPDRLFNSSMLKNGDIIFMGNGYLQFNPQSLEQRSPVQRVYITELVAGDKRYNTLSSTGLIEVESNENNFAFSYVGLNYTDPVFTRYRYRIEGYEEEWNNVGTQRRIFLANLPPGRYNFQLQAASRFGAFSENTATIEFQVNPPWWRTIPAYLAYAFLLAGSVISFDKVQRRRLIKREQEKTREKELAQAKEIERAYVELKATQNQLIQSEKMASLGELTAGIAHEIQNPLNFVNNFSEVNDELIEELREAVANNDQTEIQAILDDLKENERKIKHHGQRAEGIVKGMLQHSRTSQGEKEPTDLNALVDEYLRLAYHGMRAKDKSFNADFKTDFDAEIPKVNVIPQDIGRVLLNLINNAFYAVDKKAKEAIDGYQPEVLVSTVLYPLEGGVRGVKITVKDNGPGIPEEIKDKIFQPFFTTKPTGSGTGLGLSLSYDIVKAHCGTISVESNGNIGTKFIITLPI